MFGLGGGQFSGSVRKIFHTRDNLTFYRATDEKVFVKDRDGYMELDIPNLDMLLANPDIYIWDNAVCENGVMIYFFTLADPA